MRQFKYMLDKGSKKFACPNCGKKTFVLFVDTETDDYLSESHGRCDRETNCGYMNIPEKEINTAFEVKFIEQPAPSFHPLVLLNKLYFDDACPDNFTTHLKSMFSFAEVFRVMQEYFITGTAKPWGDATVFWQIDENERIRAGKIMLYNSHTGKRVKQPYNHVTWMHKGEVGFILSQCLFGLHRINEKSTKSVAIVESEKTAILMSLFKPEYLWMATGAKGNFKYEMLKPLKDFQIIAFPDKGEFDAWQKKAVDLNGVGFKISISDWIEKNAYPVGTDLADIYLSEMRSQPK